MNEMRIECDDFKSEKVGAYQVLTLANPQMTEIQKHDYMGTGLFEQFVDDDRFFRDELKSKYDFYDEEDMDKAREESWDAGYDDGQDMTKLHGEKQKSYDEGYDKGYQKAKSAFEPNAEFDVKGFYSLLDEHRGGLSKRQIRYWLAECKKRD